jgi:hypothetical protein
MDLGYQILQPKPAHSPEKPGTEDFVNDTAPLSAPTADFPQVRQVSNLSSASSFLTQYPSMNQRVKTDTVPNKVSGTLGLSIGKPGSERLETINSTASNDGFFNWSPPTRRRMALA